MGGVTTDYLLYVGKKKVTEENAVTEGESVKKVTFMARLQEVCD